MEHRSRDTLRVSRLPLRRPMTLVLAVLKRRLEAAGASVDVVGAFDALVVGRVVFTAEPDYDSLTESRVTAVSEDSSMIYDLASLTVARIAQILEETV